MTQRTRSANLGGTVVTSTGVVLASGLDVSNQSNAAYAQANTARNTANNAFDHANSAFAHANTIFDQANAAYLQANTARSDSNTTFATVNSTFGTVNTAVTNAHNQANTATTIGQNAYGQANLAYAAANNSNLLSGGLVSGTINVTQDLIVGGNIYLEGNTTYINVSTYSIEDSLVYYASNNKLTDSVDIGFMGGKNTSGIYSHTGLARDATDGKWKLFDGLPEEGHVGNVVNFANTYLATLVANVEANSITVLGNRVAVNTEVAAAYNQANAAYNQANSAFTAANNRVLKSGDTMTGSLTLGAGRTVGAGGAVLSSTGLNTDVLANGRTAGVSTGWGTFRIHQEAGNPGLIIAGDAGQTAPYMRIQNNAESALLVFSASGNLGIGTTSPSTTLQVNGTITTTGLTVTNTINGSINGNAGTVTNGVYQNQYGSFQSSFTNNIDANTNRNVGAYGSYSSGATNTPTNSGILLNFTSGSDGSGDGAQLWMSYSSLELYGRHRWGGGWSSWRTYLSTNNYNSYAPTLTGGGASGTWGISITGNAATATSADQIDGVAFRNTGSNASTAADSLDQNGITYVATNISLFGQTDGALYSQAYSSSWQHQIYGDYRTGQIAIRGKNNGTWQAWRSVLDSSNYTSYAPSLTGGGASGTWGISITGTAAVASNITGGMPNNSDHYLNFRVIRNSNSSTNADGMFIGYGNSGSGVTRIYGGGSTATPLIKYSDYTIEEGGNGLRAQIFYDSNNTGYYCDPASTSRLNTIYCGDVYNDLGGWFRNYGATGIYNQSYATHFYSDGAAYWNLHSGNGLVIRNGYGGTIQGYLYYDGSGFGLLHSGGGWAVRTWNGGVQTYGALTVGTSTSSDIYMTDSDETTRRIHCNSNRIGFLTSANAWGSYTDNSGNLFSDFSARAPIFYDSNDTNYYGDFNSQSHFHRLLLKGYAGSTTSGGVVAFELQNNGGTGDNNVAAMAFHCTGTYATHMHLRADGYFGMGGWSASTWRWYVNMNNGDFTAAGNVTAYSDPRLKTNIRKIDSALDKVLSLNGVKFQWIQSSVIGNPGKDDYGILSNEVAKIAPEIVIDSIFDSEDGDKYKTVAYDKLVPFLIEAIKEQQAQIEELKNLIKERLN